MTTVIEIGSTAGAERRIKMELLEPGGPQGPAHILRLIDFPETIAQGVAIPHDEKAPREHQQHRGGNRGGEQHKLLRVNSAGDDKAEHHEGQHPEGHA